MASSPINPFADRLRGYREYHGLSVAELAGILGVTRSCVHSLEAGMTAPSMSTVRSVASLMGMTLEDVGQQIMEFPGVRLKGSDVPSQGLNAVPSSVARALSVYMRAHSVSARELALQLGLTHPTVVALSRGATDVTVKSLQAIARFLGLTWEETGVLALLEPLASPRKGRAPRRRR